MGNYKTKNNIASYLMQYIVNNDILDLFIYLRLCFL